jgi:hypothetical protein
VLELARCEWTLRRENVIALGPSGTGKTHVALGLGLAACQKGLSVSFTTAAALVNELMEARGERRLLRLQKQLAGVKLLIIDEPGFVPLSKTGAELLFELISQRHERGPTLITSNLPFDEWTFARSFGPVAVAGSPFGTERLTGLLPISRLLPCCGSPQGPPCAKPAPLRVSTPTRPMWAFRWRLSRHRLECIGRRLLPIQAFGLRLGCTKRPKCSCDEMNKSERFKVLLERGFFPAELPPPFVTETFAKFRQIEFIANGLP